MKNNIFGYLFFIFIIGIMSFAIYKVNSSKSEETTNTIESTSSITNTQKGTDLTLGISEFDTINPIITSNKKVQDITKLIYEPLVNITSDGKAEPWLAKEWETTDNKTYIVKLRTGVKWSDNTYFSSSDVKYTIDRLKEAENSVYIENVKYVNEVDIIDNTTLRIILSETVPFYEYYLSFPILSNKYYSGEDFWNTDKNKSPITTGRFKISEVTEKTITLEKNDIWWNKSNDDSTIKKVTINLYSSVAELYNAFKLGSIDLIATTNEKYQDYIGKIGYNVTEIEGRNFTFLALNTQNRLLSDVNVRKAIKYAINKDEIISSVYNQTYTRANFPLNTNSFLVEDKVENYFDTEETNKLLKEAGWNLRRNQWQKIIDYRTAKLEFSLVVKNNTNRTQVAEYIKNALENQGILVNIIKASSSDYNKIIENKQYDMLLCEVTTSISPDLSTYFENGNLANFSNDETNEIMGYIDNITDEAELKTKYQKLYEIYNNETPYIGLARNKIYVITNSYLTAEIEAKWYNLFFKFKDWYTS